MQSKIQEFFFGNKQRTMAILGVAMLLFAFITFGLVYAKYISEVKTDGAAVMKEFYFTSNLLDGKTHTLAAGTTEVSFTIGNHADDLRYSEVDIDYEISVVDLTSSSTFSLSPSSGTLLSGSVLDCPVTLSGLVPGHSYKITAVGNGGYHSEIFATIVVPSVSSNLYYYLDTSDSEFVVLTVWSQGFEGDVTVSCPSSVLPDNTDPVMADVPFGGEFTDSVSFVSSGYSSHAYRFFGSGVTVTDFTVTGVTSSGSSVTASARRPS